MQTPRYFALSANSFYDTFHPHLPIIDTTMPVHAVQKSSPFLFWTILFTAARYHTDYVSGSNLLMAPYSTLTNQTILQTPHSLHSIQAILYLCMWPLPVMHQPDDPGVMYSGIAIHAASYLGLANSAGSISRTLAKVQPSDREAMSRTWLGCFVVNTASVPQTKSHTRS